MVDSNKIFCVGFSKTGTTSIEKALEILGYNVCKGHWKLKHNDYNLALYVNRNYDELYRMTRYWDAFCDGPWGGTDLYKKLVDWYPEGYFIHTVRDVESWYQSFENMLTKFDANLDTALELMHANGRYGTSFFVKNVYEISKITGNKEKIKDFYLKTNESMEIYLKEKNAKYIKIDMSNDNCWEILCNFLGKEIPDIEFPHLNKSPDNNSISINIETISHRSRLKRFIKNLLSY